MAPRGPGSTCGLSVDGEAADGASAFSGVRFMGLARVLEEGEHGVATNPVLEMGGDTEGGCAGIVGGGGVLPTDVGEDEMLGGVGGPEVVDIGVVEGEGGAPGGRDQTGGDQRTGRGWAGCGLMLRCWRSCG